MKKLITLVMAAMIVLSTFAGCTTKKERETIVIYSAANTKRLENMQQMLSEKFPDYDFVVEYLGTSKLAAKLMAEGTDTDIDIIHDLSYTNMNKLSEMGYLTKLDWVDYSRYFEDGNPASKDYVIECKVCGAVAVNTKMLQETPSNSGTAPKHDGMLLFNSNNRSSADRRKPQRFHFCNGRRDNLVFFFSPRYNSIF